MTSKREARLQELDGARGVAILLVIVFHYFGRFTAERGDALYPYGDTFSRWPIVAQGFVGVYLFFIVSGFVILRSLRQSSSLLQFVAKRADRLVLPMLVLSLVTFLLLSGPLATDGFDVGPLGFLPSWTFTAPELWRWIDPNIDYIDGAYWSLFVEVRFYLIVAVLWFLWRSRALAIFIGWAIVSVLLYAASRALGLQAARAILEVATFPQYIALFAAGMVYAEMFDHGANRTRLLYLVVLVPLSIAGLYYNAAARADILSVGVWVLAFHAMFLGIALRQSWASILAWRPLALLGLVSYSLYLLHQRVGVALISRLPVGQPLWVQLIGVAIVVVLITIAASVSWRWIERQKLFSYLLGTRLEFTAELPDVGKIRSKNPRR